MSGRYHLFGSNLRTIALCTWMVLIVIVAVHADAGQNASSSQAVQSTGEQPTSPDPSEDEPLQSHGGAFVGVPVPISSPALGTGASVLAGYIFPLVANDKLSPPSIIGGAGLFTNNGTRAFVVGTELYFKENRYHILTGFAHGDLNYDFYGIGSEAGNTGSKLGLNQTGTVFFVEALRRVGWKIFVGPRVWVGSSVLAAQTFAEGHPDLPPLDVRFNMRSVGFKVERDTTPNRFYPEKGTSLQLNAVFPPFTGALYKRFASEAYPCFSSQLQLSPVEAGGLRTNTRQD